MRVVLRADASRTQGTGHVMRCLTLGEELAARGHDVRLATSDLPEGWLQAAVAESGFPLIESERDSMGDSPYAADWVVVDSYRIPATEISAVQRDTRVLAIVDSDDRGIDAALYLDQNLGATAPPARHGRTLAGADYALVRRAILEQRRPEPWRFDHERPRIVSFMGGTDPLGASTAVARALISAASGAEFAIVAPEQQHAAIADVTRDHGGTTILAPTPELPALFGRADLVVTAAGTSAWDVCALGIPAVLIAVVDNQAPSVAEAMRRGVALGADVVDDLGSLGDRVAPLLITLLSDEEARRDLSAACRATFDGLGPARVADRLEQEEPSR